MKMKFLKWAHGSSDEFDRRKSDIDKATEMIFYRSRDEVLLGVPGATLFFVETIDVPIGKRIPIEKEIIFEMANRAKAARF